MQRRDHIIIRSQVQWQAPEFGEHLVEPAALPTGGLIELLPLLGVQRIDPAHAADYRRNAEAWMAIVACNSPLAEEFLAHAARDPLLLGHYNAARLRQQHLTP